MSPQSTDASGVRPSGDTRERILEAGQQLIQSESYDGFSFRDVAAIVGIRKASIYHHFESKEALAAAMAERARERFERWATTQSARPPGARLTAYCFDLYGKHLGAGENLCPGGALVSGWAHLSDDVRAAVTSLLEAHVEFILSALREGSRTGALTAPPRQSLAGTARWFVASVQGALIWARAMGGHATFEHICNTTLGSLQATGKSG